MRKRNPANVPVTETRSVLFAVLSPLEIPEQVFRCFRTVVVPPFTGRFFRDDRAVECGQRADFVSRFVGVLDDVDEIFADPCVVGDGLLRETRP